MLRNQHTLGEHAVIAKEIIEGSTHTAIWRTATRIHELIRTSIPYWKNNYFLKDEKEFAVLLGAMCHEQELRSINFPKLSFERYEEGQHEPIMLCDTQFPGKPLGINEVVTSIVPKYTNNDVRAYIIQREMYRLLQEGYSFTESYKRIRKLDPEIRNTYVYEFEQCGMESGNIFYRRIDDSGAKIEEVSRILVTTE